MHASRSGTAHTACAVYSDTDMRLMKNGVVIGGEDGSVTLRGFGFGEPGERDDQRTAKEKQKGYTLSRPAAPKAKRCTPTSRLTLPPPPPPGRLTGQLTFAVMSSVGLRRPNRIDRIANVIFYALCFYFPGPLVVVFFRRAVADLACPRGCI